MANYYNLTAWKHTGFDYRNRPYNREVLNTEYFTQSDHYIQMSGIVVKRDDTSGLTYVDVQGSVKDIRGTQVNAPNVTGSQGPGGPWYSWEEVDYVRLARTGYPGDEDFVDISGNQMDPWNAPHSGKPVYTGYYFVTGLQQMARNVTRLFLSEDYWLTMGGADELEIETGYKIRGPITEAEDASSYNEASEGIGLIHPLITIGHQTLNPQATRTGKSFIVSAIDVSTIADSDSMEGLSVSAGGSTYVIPKIDKASKSGNVTMKEPDGTQRTFFLSDIDLFDPSDSKVQNGLTALYSSGQLELQDSYFIPEQYIGSAATSSGKYTGMTNAVQSITPTIKKDISSYPRKADYMFGSMVLYSIGSGSQNVQKFSQLEDATVQIWASLAPTGNPYARFKSIKSHPYLYDQAVQGMTWTKNSVVMQGAAGSMWNQINYAFQQGEMSTQQAELDIAKRSREYNRTTGFVDRAGSAIGSAVGAAAGMLGSRRRVNTGASIASGLSGQLSDPLVEVNARRDYDIEGAKLDMQQISIDNQAAQNELSLAKSNNVAPYADFVPDINKALFTSNEFGLYVINTDTADRQRLRNFFNRYGYSGLYKTLTWDVIHVKSKVNFIQAEGVVLKHSHFPLRDTVECAKLLESGLFLWDERPNAAAFASQTDAT